MKDKVLEQRVKEVGEMFLPKGNNNHLKNTTRDISEMMLGDLIHEAIKMGLEIQTNTDYHRIEEYQSLIREINERERKYSFRDY